MRSHEYHVCEICGEWTECTDERCFVPANHCGRDHAVGADGGDADGAALRLKKFMP